MPTGLLDTSVVIDLHLPEILDALPDASAISTITLAELALGPHLAKDAEERGRRQARLQVVEATFDAIVFDAVAARSFAVIVAATLRIGRSHRRRMADLLIAATAHAHNLPLYTRNADDLKGAASMLTLITV